MNHDQVIGNRISEARNILGLSQPEFAEQLNISRSKLANYERGRTILPCGLGLNLCRIFFISEKWLATGSGWMMPAADLIHHENIHKINPSRSFILEYERILSTMLPAQYYRGPFDWIEKTAGSSADDNARLRLLLLYVLHLLNPQRVFSITQMIEEAEGETPPNLFLDLILTCRNYWLRAFGTNFEWDKPLSAIDLVSAPAQKKPLKTKQAGK